MKTLDEIRAIAKSSFNYEINWEMFDEDPEEFNRTIKWCNEITEAVTGLEHLYQQLYLNQLDVPKKDLRALRNQIRNQLISAYHAIELGNMLKSINEITI